MRCRSAHAPPRFSSRCGNGAGPEPTPQVIAAGEHPGAAFLSVAEHRGSVSAGGGGQPGTGGKVLHWRGSAWSELRIRGDSTCGGFTCSARRR